MSNMPYDDLVPEALHLRAALNWAGIPFELTDLDHLAEEHRAFRVLLDQLWTADVPFVVPGGDEDRR